MFGRLPLGRTEGHWSSSLSDAFGSDWEELRSVRPASPEQILDIKNLTVYDDPFGADVKTMQAAQGKIFSVSSNIHNQQFSVFDCAYHLIHYK